MWTRTEAGLLDNSAMTLRPHLGLARERAAISNGAAEVALVL
jgi:hypothetical protein